MVTSTSGTTARSAWHTDDYPELRAAPPWVTEEMVASQPGLVVPILTNARTADLAQMILDVDESGDPIVVTGCGTSEHGAMAVAELLDAALRQRGARSGRVEARQAFEAALDPRSGGLCIAVTESGGTRTTMLALATAARLGMPVAAILSPEASQEIPETLTPAGRIILPGGVDPLPPLSALLGGAAALQRVTLAMVAAAGVNPDLIRREEAPYREAADIVEGATDW